MQKKSYIQFLERKNYPFFLIELLIREGVTDLEYLQDRKKVKRLQGLIEAKDLEVETEPATRNTTPSSWPSSSGSTACP